MIKPVLLSPPPVHSDPAYAAHYAHAAASYPPQQVVYASAQPGTAPYDAYAEHYAAPPAAAVASACCVMNQQIKDETDTEIYHVSGGVCQLGICCPCCGEVVFNIEEGTGGGQPVGKVRQGKHNEPFNERVELFNAWLPWKTYKASAATALVRPSHVTAAHALSDVANCPF